MEERKESPKEDTECRGSQVPKQKVKIQKKKKKKKKDPVLEFVEAEVVENTNSVKDKVEVNNKKKQKVEVFVGDGEEGVMKNSMTSVEECKNVSTNKNIQK